MQFYDSRMHIQLEHWDITKTFAAIDEWASRSDLHEAFVIFHMVKVVNRIRLMDAPPLPSAPPEPEDTILLREIRDSLKK
jgi:hypothetical protein